VELAPDNVLVNTIAPGVTDTPMSQAGFSAEEQQRRRALHPLLGGYTSVEEITGLVRYMISDATKNVTGQLFLLRNP